MFSGSGDTELEKLLFRIIFSFRNQRAHVKVGILFIKKEPEILTLSNTSCF